MCYLFIDEFVWSFHHILTLPTCPCQLGFLHTHPSIHCSTNTSIYLYVSATHFLSYHILHTHIPSHTNTHTHALTPSIPLPHTHTGVLTTSDLKIRFAVVRGEVRHETFVRIRPQVGVTAIHLLISYLKPY
jgi:hypothetical protein